MEQETKIDDYDQIDQLYDECLMYLQNVTKTDETPLLIDDYTINKDDGYPHEIITNTIKEEPDYEIIRERNGVTIVEISDDEASNDNTIENPVEFDSNPPDYESIKHDEPVYAKVEPKIQNFNEHINFQIENEVQTLGSVTSLPDLKSVRLRRLSEQLPKIIITQSNTSISKNKETKRELPRIEKRPFHTNCSTRKSSPTPRKAGYGDYPKRVVSKSGLENVALISNVPYERIRLLNDTFHTLINLRWRWIVMGTVVVHFAIWLVFAVFWYITALAHYDFEPNPPKKTCITGGKDFVTIFLASVEAQTTIGFGDRAIDEECPESIFLFIMQLILGTGLSGVLTCVVYAKLTRPEKLSRDGVGFSKKAVIGIRDGRLCLMMRVWDLNYDHIISSVFTAHFVNTHRTKEGETIRFYAQILELQQRQFLLWPVTLVHVIDQDSPLYGFTPDQISNTNYEITLSLKGASASMGTFTQSQTSYMPREVVWGHRFLPVVKYDCRKQKYVIDHHKLDVTEPVDTPYCSANQLDNSSKEDSEPTCCPGTPSSFSDKMCSFQLERVSSFKRKHVKI